MRACDVIALLDTLDVAEVAVIDAGRVSGIVTRARVLEALRAQN